MKFYNLLEINTRLFKCKVIGMKGLQTVFENEEAARLLNYFISYKEVISKTENKNEPIVAVGVLPKPEELTIK